MKKSISDLFNSSENKEEMLENSNIFSILFKARNDAHITHLLNKDKTLATHKALEIFYEEILDLLDSFIETSLYIYPVTDIEVGESKCIPNPLSYFEKLYKIIDNERKVYKESFLQNQVDEIQSLISQTIYRLKYITT